MDLAKTFGKDKRIELMRKKPMRRSLCKSRQNVMNILAAKRKRNRFFKKDVKSS